MVVERRVPLGDAQNAVAVLLADTPSHIFTRDKAYVERGESERPRSLLLSLGVPSRPSPGSYPGPVQVPSRVRGGPVQIRHVLCFTVFRTHPGPEVGGHPGPSWSHPAPERSFQDRAWTGRNRLLGHFRGKPPLRSSGPIPKNRI